MRDNGREVVTCFLGKNIEGMDRDELIYALRLSLSLWQQADKLLGTYRQCVTTATGRN